MNTIIISVWLVQNEYLENVLKLAHMLKESSLKEKGNVSYKVYQSKKEPNRLMLFEEYVSEEALMQHVESAHYQEIAVKGIHLFLLERTNDFQVKL